MDSYEMESNQMINPVEEEFEDSKEISHIPETNNHPHKKNGSSLVDLVCKKDNEKNHLNNLYQNIGTRVSKLREINENYKQKIQGQNQEIFIFDERIAEKQKILAQIREAKKTNNKEFINQKYLELFKKDNLKLDKKNLNQNLIIKDPVIRKVYNENEKEVGHLNDNLNSLIKKTEDISSQINKLRLDNHKLQENLDNILKIKEERSKEMDRISEEANKYLHEKDTVNKNLIDLNQKIDEQKQQYEYEMQNINKMIDNTKKIKQFHENMAVEKFSKSNTKKNFYGPESNAHVGTGNKITEEKNKLEELTKELEKKKRITIYLNFSRFILFKKQQELQKIVEEVKQQTGIESLDSLSKYLEMSTKTNKLFESDIKNLNEQKDVLEKKIISVQQEVQNSQCFLNDTSTKKFEYLEKIRIEIKAEELVKKEMNRKLFTMNRVIDVLADGFKKTCLSMRFFDVEMKFDAEVIYLTFLIISFDFSKEM